MISDHLHAIISGATISRLTRTGNYLNITVKSAPADTQELGISNPQPRESRVLSWNGCAGVEQNDVQQKIRDIPQHLSSRLICEHSQETGTVSKNRVVT
jgi:hypothetical protein